MHHYNLEHNIFHNVCRLYHINNIIKMASEIGDNSQLVVQYLPIYYNANMIVRIKQ